MLAAAMQASADFGFANSQCSHWLDPEMADQEMARHQWVFGYLTAAACYSNQELLNTDPNKLLKKLRERCNAHPTESLESATEALLGELIPTR
jgi:hypothetical protein